MGSLVAMDARLPFLNSLKMEVIMEVPKKFDRRPATVRRRERVIKRLENQLLTGFKNVTNEKGEIGSEKLTDRDKERIQKEIETLKTRL